MGIRMTIPHRTSLQHWSREPLPDLSAFRTTAQNALPWPPVRVEIPLCGSTCAWPMQGLKPQPQHWEVFHSVEGHHHLSVRILACSPSLPSLGAQALYLLPYEPRTSPQALMTPEVLTPKAPDHLLWHFISRLFHTNTLEFLALSSLQPCP